MRKIVFLLSIVAVIAVVGAYTFLELRVNDIYFVADKAETHSFGREMVVRRLYNSEVDIDAFFDSVEQNLISAEFTDDELYAAALASGNPEFCPVFYFNIYRPHVSDDVFEFTGALRQELAQGQTDFNFKAVNTRLEIVTDGPVISDVILRPEDDSDKSLAKPVISADGRSMAVDLSGILGYRLTLTGTGSVTFQYTYDIAANRLISTNVLEEQFLMVHANIQSDQNGDFTVEYICEPYSDLEEFFY